MFEYNPIRRRVLAAVNQMIDKAEEEYRAQVRHLRKKFEQDRKVALEEKVKAILGKFL